MTVYENIEKIVKIKEIFHSILEGNEAQTRWMLIDPFILDCWGYSREDIIVEYNMETEDRVSRYNKLDYSIMVNNKPKILVEAKSLGINLFEKYNQLEEYFSTILSRYDFVEKELIGILTDGDIYLFYTNSIKDKMDSVPFYTTSLSSSDEIDILKILEYSKSNIRKSKVVTSGEVYELGVSYRIDVIDNIYDYFNSQGIDIGIDKVYIQGRMRPIKNYRKLYKELIKYVDILKPNLLYELAKNEDKEVNGKIVSAKFSLSKISSSEMEFVTKNGVIHISIPSTRRGLIDRIIYLVKASNFGIQNILVSFKEK